MRKKVLAMMLLAVIALALVACPRAQAAKESAVRLNGQTAHSPMTYDMSKGASAQLSCEGATRWRSSNRNVLTVDKNGFVTFLRPGTATAYATTPSGEKGLKFTVVASVTGLSISGADSVTAGKRVRLTAAVLPRNASDKRVVWTSSNPSLAKVDGSGLVTAGKTASCQNVTITATSRANGAVLAQKTLTVTPSVASVKLYAGGQIASGTLTIDTSCGEKTLALSAIVSPAQASGAVTWKTSSSRVATVDGNGLVTARANGTVTITATAKDGSGKKASVKVRVTAKVTQITIAGQTSLVAKGKTTLKAAVLPANAVQRGVVWTSSDTTVATVNASGRVTAKQVAATRTVVITATAKDGGAKATHAITVVPRAASVSISREGRAVSAFSIDIAGANRTVRLAAVVSPADANGAVKWSSSNTRVATVGQSGLVTGLRAGSAKITATAQDGSGRRTSVTVTVATLAKGVSISGAQTVAGGLSTQLKATVSPSTTTKKAVAWSSSNESVATVNASGKVITKPVSAATQVVITATAKDGGLAAGTHTITVTPRAASVQITLGGSPIANSTFLDLSKTRTLALDAKVYPLAASQKVVWSSSKSSVATVDRNGLVSAKKAGVTKITARSAENSQALATYVLGVADLSGLPYYIEVDRGMQVVRVYEKAEDGSYTKLLRLMICSSGYRKEIPASYLYQLNGSHLRWMDGIAQYATRIVDCYLFHSILFENRSPNKLDKKAYQSLGNNVSGGCIRLLTGDAKWIYDNVPKGTMVRFVYGTKDEALLARLKPALKGGRWDPTDPNPGNPDFDPTYTSQVK